MNRFCSSCNKPSGTLYMEGDEWVCRHCWTGEAKPQTCRLFEKGAENPYDKDGTTAHVRDIKSRRWHPTEKRMFYYKPSASYFFPKG